MAPAEPLDENRLKRSRYRHWTTDHVRFGDLDALGHTNNNAIGVYFENARAILFQEVAPGWPVRQEIFVLAHIAIDYRQELHMPAELAIGSVVLNLGNTSMRLGSALFHGDAAIAYAETVSVLIDRGSRKPIRLTDSIRALLTAYAN